MWANLLQKSQKKVSLYPVPTLVGDGARKKYKPAVGTRLVQLIFCKNRKRKFHFIIVYPKKGRK
ncbi:hypothetical protein DXB51_08610 [Bacillus cereus]|nr:hypothetical protein DXB51_08610 [Bacillus cereus]